ncbi:Ig-like domain-containing protein [Mucilaginibacter sp. ZT4R22]|uniref:Ig-like domain-containing protein n=1 Tax=Mucilaginibacter pankratovii TaxID=2772110 RepID=A0ABR7WNZ0_9SPHI|nr:Ig-like domain-containing protein [Mucilaginibacter pankratovii]MBD1363079.1 Ig-like domain-containing protein [Mucilaginibacter pankratovii]
MTSIFNFLKKFLFLPFLIIVTVTFIFFSANALKGKIAASDNIKTPDLFNLASAPLIENIRINFQDENTQAPPGWLKDTGEPFSEHPGIYEGSGLTFGWKNQLTNQPLSLQGNGRARLEPEDVLLSTFVHMQASDISALRYGPFDGVKANGYWELKVLNGVYKVTVAAGDGAVTKAKQVDCLNVEGVKAISNFIPIGKLRSPGRFKEATVTVTVTDGLLTIDANGGTNTKICYVSIVPISATPYLYLLSPQQNLLIEKQSKAKHIAILKLNNSLQQKITYSISATYLNGNNKWLSFSATKTNKDSVQIDYSSGRSLPVGNYPAKIQVSSDGYAPASIDILLRVVDNTRPYVIAANPINGSTITSNITIAANSLFIPAAKGFKGGTDNATITNKTVRLLKLDNGKEVNVQGNVQGTGGGDAISFTPSQPLEPYTNYKFIITNGVKTYNGTPFVPFESSFSTALAPIDSSNIIKAEFTKISVPGTQNKKYTSLLFGPDGKFYALKIDGGIERYKVDHQSGMLSGMQPINTLVKKRGESTAIGLTFDPKSSQQNLIAWVSYSSAGLNAAPVFDGKISRLSGSELQNEEQVIVNLPRSTRDHMVNSMAFGPDGALYISQGSNSSAGNYDKGWQREETLLSGAILRLDISKLNTVKLPLDVKTSDKQNLINHASAVNIKLTDGGYNPYAYNSPLTIYASGIRNAYDMVWHSNGQLYIPANGSGGGGNSPASVEKTKRPDGSYYTGPAVSATENVPVQHDWLFRVNPNKGIGYYGHPNPLRGEYIINRGFADNPMYNPAVKPDKNYRGAAFDFGYNKSPNGVIEYKSNAFNGALKGKLLVCRFSGGGDIMVLEPGSMSKLSDAKSQNGSEYNIVKSATGAGNYGLQGMVGFANPLDLTEDVTNGNLYVSEFNWNENPNLTSQITLLKVVQKQQRKVKAAQKRITRPLKRR